MAVRKKGQNEFTLDQAKRGTASWLGNYYIKGTTGGSQYIEKSIRKNTVSSGSLGSSIYTWIAMPDDIGYVQGRLREMTNNQYPSYCDALRTTTQNPNDLVKAAANAGFTIKYPYLFDGSPNSKYSNYKLSGGNPILNTNAVPKVGDICVFYNPQGRGQCGIIEEISSATVGCPVFTISESKRGSIFFTSEVIDPFCYCNSDTVGSKMRWDGGLGTKHTADIAHRLNSSGLFFLAYISLPSASGYALMADNRMRFTGWSSSSVFQINNGVWIP